MKNEIKPLYESGWAVITLKPKSKAPVHTKWTSGPRVKWDALKIAPENNVGVRLGRASALKAGGFLAVVDCDVKGGPEYAVEVNRILDEMGIPQKWVVETGRGGGSKHIYFRSDAPLKPKRLYQSPDIVKVRMPSVSPSRRERAELTDVELKGGIRLRPAFEISLMGEGQQCVLPPSIHPDSGRRYKWTRREGDAPPKFEGGEKATTPKADKEKPIGADFTPVDKVDLTFISDETVKAITTGEGVLDRSASLIKVIQEMRTKGMSKNEIATVLTDRDNYLGCVAYDHAKTKDRTRAAKWLFKYGGIEKVFRPGLSDFDSPIEAGAVDKEAAFSTASELVEPPKDWKAGIERGKNDAPKGNFRNACLVLTNSTGPGPLVSHDQFADRYRWEKDTPWGNRKGEELKDVDNVLILDYLAHKFRMDVTDRTIYQAVLSLAHKNARHPVREFLKGLEWDGTPRIDSWLKTYLGARGPEAYLKAVGRKMLCAMVARVMRPGTYFAHVPVFEGKQRVGKSSTVSILGAPWTNDTVLDIRNKDSMQTLKGIWVLEISELAQFSRADTALVKNFISSSTDRYRPPYGRTVQEFPRQCVFMGTTNEAEYLRDATGNTRFWPVRFGDERMNRDKLIKDRDQLLAEAFIAWEWNEPLNLETPELERLQENEARKRDESDDIMEDAVANFLAEHGADEPFRMEQVFDANFDIFGGKKTDRLSMLRLGQTLRKMGFEKRIIWGSGKTVKRWFKKEE